MISPGRLRADIDAVAQLLKKRGLLRERNLGDREALGAANLAGLSYQDQWEKILDANDYDMRLGDGAILSFQRTVNEGGGVRYIWMESPRTVILYEDYARQYALDLMSEAAEVQPSETQIKGVLDEFAWDIGEEYELYLTELPLKHFVTPIRYEFHPASYKPGWHPASHIHIGQNMNIRIGCNHVLTPFAFVLFVIRQVYNEHWRELINTEGWLDENRHKIREIAVVPDEYRTEVDRTELWLA